MSFHLAHRTRFLQNTQIGDVPQILDNASRYDVRLEAANVAAGTRYWRLDGVYHLSPDENRGKHGIYVDVVDENGQRIRDGGLRLIWGWEGQQSTQHSDPKPFDKPDNEPATNVDLFLGQHTWVSVEGEGLPSDRVTNIHSNHPDEPGPSGETWNSVGHHSFYVLFQRSVKSSGAGGVAQPQNGNGTANNGVVGNNGAGNNGTPPLQPPPIDPPVRETAGGTSGSTRVADKLGLDANQPVDEGSGAIAPQVNDPKIIAATGVGWVRLNFIVRGRWQSPNDPNWQQTYRQIINGFRSQNLRVYGLISAQAVPEDPDFFRNSPGDGPAQHDWIVRYAENFAAIARLFHQDVEVFESFNEPDNWQKWPANWINAEWFAIMLQTIHDHVRSDPMISDIKIVSGPVQGMHNNNNNGVNYLRDAYAAGKKRFGWGSNGKPFPFDGVGYHLYIAQDSNSSVDQVRQDYHKYMAQMRQMISEQEGKLKPIYLSEYGWFSNGGKEDFQARAMQAGLDEALGDDSLALVIWFSTQDFYGDADGHYFGVYRKGALTSDNRKPCFTILSTIATSARQVAVAGGLQPAAPRTTPQPATPQPQPQPQPATPPPAAPLWAGRVNAPNGLNLRQGPGQGHPTLALLVDGSALQVLGQSDGWLFVETSLGLGYVSGQYVMRADQNISHLSTADRVLLDAWTRYRELISQESTRLAINPGVAVAVLLTESGGDAFRDGRMVIRFENHIFFDQWGKNNVARFNQHFTFNQETQWVDHQWRPDPNQSFRTCHTSQNEEWAVFDFARSLDEAAAIRSISMGAPQIMGFNHAAIGYTSPQAMFDAFRSSADAQIRGMFRFVDSKKVVGALQSGDYVRFAKVYNGTGRPEEYVEPILTYLDSFRRVVGEDAPHAAATTKGAVGVAGAVGRDVRPVMPDPEIIAEAVSKEVAVAVAKLPQPIPDKTMAEADPVLYEAWRKHIERGFENNQTMFEQVLKAFMNPYWTTVTMYRILFGLGILAIAAAAVLAVVFRDEPTIAVTTAAIFGGLGIAAFASYFISRPLQALEENLQFITWLGVIYNTYWTHMAYIRNQDTVQTEIDQTTATTIEQLNRLLDKNAAFRAKRPELQQANQLPDVIPPVIPPAGNG